MQFFKNVLKDKENKGFGKWAFVIAFLYMTTFYKAQTIPQCKQRFDKYLNFKGNLNSVVKFENDAIHILNNKGKADFSIYAHEIEMLGEFLEHSTFKQQEQLLKLKGTKRYSKRQRDSLWIYIDNTKSLPPKNKALPLQGFRVAIDPGHFGVTLNDARVEQKYLYFVKDSIADPHDTVKLFESELNFITASLLKKMLEEQGAKVLVTRSNAGHTSFDCNYSDYLSKHKKRVLDSLHNSGSMNSERYKHLTNADPYTFFWDYFRDADLANRAKKINSFNPHATAIIHYNVDEKNAPWTKSSSKNFTMTFIGGAFTSANLERTESKLHFIRLLLTDELNRSEKLASYTVNNFSKLLQIPIAGSPDAEYLRDNCITTSSKGVFARNLLLCRLINSPLVYGEALYQDCGSECKAMMQRDIEKYGIKTNERLLLTAKSYYSALSQFLRELKK